MDWYMEACHICGGTLHDDLDDKGWVTCFVCVRSFRKADLNLGTAPARGGSEERTPTGTPTTSEWIARAA
jgi:hypothetical protein